MKGTRIGAATLAVLAVATGCGRTAPAGRDTTQSPQAARQVARPAGAIDTFHRGDQRFFTAFVYPEGAEAEVYQSLDGALESATAVVLAQVTDVRVTRLVGESPADALPYMGVSLRPVDVLRGSLPPSHARSLTVEFVAPGGTAEELRATLPTGYAIWVLRNKAERPARSEGKPPVPATERDFYRLVSSQGLFVQGETHVVNPLDLPEGPEIAPSGDGHGAARRDPVATGAERFATLSSLAAHARAL